MPHRQCRRTSAILLCGIMCLFLWQASIYPVLGNGSNSRVLLSYSVAKEETKSVTKVNNTTTIVIQRGDTLWDLARKYETTVNQLVSLNQFKSPNQIREGQLITVPIPVKTTAPFPMDELAKTEEPYSYPRYSMAKQEGIYQKTTGGTTKQKESQSSWWEIVLERLTSLVVANKAEPVSIVSSNAHPSESDPNISMYEVYVNQNTEEETDHIVEETANTLSRSELADLHDDRSKLATNQTENKSGNQIHSRGLGRFVTQEEVELLSRVIHGEARGENFEGQVAVGAVVLNRLKDPRFPKTLQTVVYQSGQFTAVNDKQIYLDPNEQSYKAAEAALSGQDPTNGAIFYYNPRIATDQWIKTRPVIKRIGNHDFSI